MTKVALSGASGGVGRILRPLLVKQGVRLRSAGWPDSPEPLVPDEDVMHGDLRDAAVSDRLLEGVDVLIHLAGTSVERPLPEIIQNNLVGLEAVYEGARRQGVKRIVFASSNHVFGMYSVNDKLTLDTPFRPDEFYGLSKAWGECARPHVLGQARHRRNHVADRQHPRTANRVPASQHMVRLPGCPPVHDAMHR